jgi:hypothetical protein
MLKFLLKVAVAIVAVSTLLYVQAHTVINAYERGKFTVFYDCSKTGVAIMGRLVLVCEVAPLDKPPARPTT